jgi:hypothetical protein
VDLAHINDPVVCDLPGFTRQKRLNNSLLLLNGHVDRLGRYDGIILGGSVTMGKKINKREYMKNMHLGRWTRSNG